MKKNIIILTTIIITFLSSGCKRRTLTCPYSGLKIVTTGYTFPEIDSIMVYRFQNDGSFNNMIDSSFLKIDSFYTNPSIDTLNLSYIGFKIENNVDTLLDFKIKILSDNKIVSLSKFNIDFKTYSIHWTTMEKGTKCISPILNYFQDGNKVENLDDKLYIKK